MPYIKQEQRPPIDELVDQLADLVSYNTGSLNYAITRLIHKKWEELPCYAELNRLLGVLECVKHEFYRTMGALHESRKMSENGPVEL